jgi:threonine/homoserine efflux transporter RhtA
MATLLMGGVGSGLSCFGFALLLARSGLIFLFLLLRKLKKIDEMGIFFACIFCGFLTYSIYILRHVVS